MSELPTTWVNILADHPEYAHRERKQSAPPPTAPTGLKPQVPLDLFRQSTSTTMAEVEIPAEVRDLYALWRPTPLRRAVRFEAALGTNARIYFKFEGQSPTGSHKLNTAIAQTYYLKKAGATHVVTGTGAGQWGSALALATHRFGLGCTVFMPMVSLRQKPSRRVMMELYGGELFESPSPRTSVGREYAAAHPDALGSLAVATGEAIELAKSQEGYRFAVGSGENHVLLHQTVIGQEAIAQMTQLDDWPDVVTACMGAGSNFAGVVFPFMRACRSRGLTTRFIAAEPIACPKLTRGHYAFERNDFSETTPITRMYTLGRKFEAPGIHAGGLRYHGTSPLLSAMYHDKLFEARAYPQRRTFEIASMFMKAEGLVPAPESAYAICAAADVAATSPRGTRILINISGHGLLDLSAYSDFASGKLDDGAPSEDLIRQSLAQLELDNREEPR